MNKTVYITGASRGIGRAIAVYFANAGYIVGIQSKCDKDGLDITEKLAKGQGAKEVYKSMYDITDSKAVNDDIHAFADRFGHIDVLINNVGIAHIGLLQDMNDDEWRQIIDTNLTSVFYTSRAAIPYMLQSKTDNENDDCAGRIINISSIWGQVGASCEVAYSATKGGVDSFTKALAKELAPSSIAVNAVSCGMVDTSMNGHLSEDEINDITEEIPAGRIASPEEIAKLVYQVANSGSYMTGQIIRIDGGWA